MKKEEQEALLKGIRKRINDTRLNRDYSQQRLANKIGVTQPVITNIISGKAYPKITTLIDLAKALNVSFNWLVFGDEEVR